MPIPGYGVDHDLAIFYAAEGREANKRGNEGEDAGGEMERVCVGDDVEGVATETAGFEGRSEGGELMPGDRLADEEERTEGKSGDEPGQSSAGGGLAEAEPFFHGIDLVKHVPAGEFDSYGTEEKDGCVEPEDRWDSGGEPVVDVVIVGIDVAGGLGVEEEADDADEEHEDGAEGEEKSEAVGGKALSGTALRPGRIIAIVIVATAASAFEVAIIWRTPSMAAIVLFGATGSAIKIGGRDDGWQKVTSGRAR